MFHLDSHQQFQRFYAVPVRVAVMLYETESLRLTADRGVATLWLDFPGMAPNLLNAERLLKIDAALDAVLANSSIETMVLRSAKSAGFSAGLDAESLNILETEDDLREFASLGQQVCNRLATADCLTVAYIHGPCIGPGFELALACDYRLMIASADSAIGFGNVPTCWGGLSRLTRIVGATHAVEVLLGTNPLTAREAVEIGIVDHAFCERRAKIELRTFLDQQHRKPRRWHTPFDGWAARRVVRAFQNAANREPMLEVIPAAAASLHSGLLTERTVFVDSFRTVECQSRLRREQIRQRLHAVNVPAVIPATVAVIGPVAPAATILSEILLHGGTVCVHFTGESAVDDTPLKVAIAAAQQCGRVTPLEADQALKRIRYSHRPVDALQAVIVTLDTAAAIEEAETLAGPTTPILCTAELRRVTKFATRPARLFGVAMHGTLAEIVRARECDDRSLLAVRSLFAHHSFTPLMVSERRGSIIRRVRAAYWDEAVRLVADGVPIAAVDAAAIALGAHVGPLEAMDGLGLDTAVQMVPGVKPLLDAGIHGRPDSEGFYLLAADNPTGPNAAAQLVLLHAADPAVQGMPNPLLNINQYEARRLACDRMLLRIITAAATILADDACLGPDEIDFAIVEGVGLLAATGGPLRHADSLGLRDCAARLRTFASQFGDRFKPGAELTRRALAGEAFHDRWPSIPRPLKLSA